MKKFLILFLALSIASFGQDETTKKDKKTNVFTDAGDAAKMILAKQKMYAGDYVGALNTYREVEKNNPKDASVLHYIGFCYYNLNQIDKAKEFLLKSIDANSIVKPENHLILGKIAHSESDFDKAIEEFTEFKTAPKQNKESVEDADIFLKQAQNAKAMAASPLDVEVINLGSDINSVYDDKNPCITADGSKLVFTTRRPETTASEVDAEGDGNYFEDIYIANYDSLTKGFGKASEVPGSINTKAHDAVTSISADGKQIFIYKNDINDKNSRGGDVFVSKVNNGKWRTPEPMGKPIASSYWEGGACVSPDGKKYFFTSERPGGFGRSDIWMVQRINKKEWGKPENLGSEVNTTFDEAGMFLAPDGKTLFFCSDRPESMGSYDVFKTVFEGGKWSTPVNLGYPINSVSKEGQLTISADAKFAYVSSNRGGGLGGSDIYKINLKDYAILEKDGKKKTSNGLSILKGTIRDGYEGYGLPDVAVVLTDASGAEISSTNTNENGEYFFTLKGGNYKITINKKGFKEISENIELKQSDKETISLEKGFLLKK
ncbi:MAG: carboxypeptidase regulatory-like domain-containing protein [Bacteroidota bacterium]|nr:carboxypeptidase regulatory-like domain-containing protein [Bacteroidota bacterium]MDP3144423.1 carboxypeptidase regulatory-like domain-containing protein [Bacteroidota bacterium]MDP3555899.1 carboxypeptidase regulatory-like domain-containing protein [Bacteroidota bacterium]